MTTPVPPTPDAGDRGRASAWRSITLVAGREVRETLRRKTFWLLAGLLFVGSTVAAVVPNVVGSDSDTVTYQVAVVGESGATDQVFDAAGELLDAEVEVTSVPTAAVARRQVTDGDVDLALEPAEEPVIIVRSGEQQRLVGATSQALADDGISRDLQGEGLSAAEARTVLAQPAPRVEEVDSQQDSRQVAALAVSLVLYILLLTLMVQVANGVATEKANRISEVLLAIVRPTALLVGKVLGVGLVGTSMLAAAIVPVSVALATSGDLPDGLGPALAGGVAWFILGLALYLTIAGALGALVERQEEAGSVVTPFTAILIGTFIVSQSAADSTLGAVLAYIPLTSPLIVPTRIAMGVSSPLELVGSLVLLVLAILVVARVGSTVYARAIVRTGRRLTLREVLRSG